MVVPSVTGKEEPVVGVVERVEQQPANSGQPSPVRIGLDPSPGFVKQRHSFVIFRIESSIAHHGH